MKKILTIYVVLFSMAVLLGCNDSPSDNKSSSESPTSNRITGQPDSSVSRPDTNNLTAGQALSDRYLESLVNGSDLIFYGKLVKIDEVLSVEGYPYTTLKYNIYEILAGRYSADKDSITIKHLGGTFANGYQLSVTNSPVVRLGEEAVVMVQQSEDTGCDLTQCLHGHFVFDGELPVTASGKTILINRRGDTTYIHQSERKKDKHRANLKTMTRANFLGHIRKLDAKTSANRKSRREVVDFDRYTAFHAYKGLTNASKAPVPPKAIAKNSRSSKQGSDFDRWEEAMLEQNGNDPVLDQYYSGN